MILGISGRAGSGKDAAASVLVREYGFVRVSFADEIKRVAQRLFGWDDERLWGPSELRNEPDLAWGGLTARRALQVLGTEVGRALHPDVWVRATMREIGRRHAPGCAWANRPRCEVRGYEHACSTLENDEGGNARLVALPRRFVVPDVRFKNEVDAIRAVGGFVLRVVRPGAELAGAAGEHASETELTDGDGLFDARIVNDGTLAEFEEKVSHLGAILTGKVPPGPPAPGAA